MDEPIRQEAGREEPRVHDKRQWPRTYRIIVEGQLDKSWSERLAGLRIIPCEQTETETGSTILEGNLRDRSELSGVMNTLESLQLSIIEMITLDSQQSNPE